MNILLVEDEADIHFMIEGMVGDRYKIIHFTDGIEVMHPSITEGIDIALVDLMLPNTSGVQVVRWLKRWTNIKVIVMTAMPEQQIHETLAMADGYLPKPFTPQELEVALA